MGQLQVACICNACSNRCGLYRVLLGLWGGRGEGGGGRDIFMEVFFEVVHPGKSLPKCQKMKQQATDGQ